MIPPIKVDTEVSNSCNNWKCCFGCKDKPKVDSPKSEYAIEETTVKVVHVYKHSPRREISPKLSVTEEKHV